jgi:pantothenate kinase
MVAWWELETPWKKLQQKWEQTKTGWDDPVSLEFEQTFLLPLAEQIQSTQRELERLKEVIIQAQRAIK